MATVVNARDVLLQSASQRLLGIDLPPNINIPVDNIPALVGVTLTASSQVIQIPSSGSPYPSAVVIKATVKGLTATPVLSVIDGSLSTTPSFDAGLQFTFTEAQMLTDVVVFKATLTQPSSTGGSPTVYTDTYTVLKVREGAGSTVGFLTNENITITADNSGNVSSYTGATGHFVVIRGITNITSSCTFAVQSNPQSLTVAIDSTGAYSVTGGFGPSLDNATVTFRATYGTLTLDKTLTLSKAKSGNAGSTGAAGDKSVPVNLYAWSTSQPANPNGSSSYDWTTASHTAYSGAAPWSTTIGTNTGVSNLKLWVATKIISATSVTTSSTVTWPSDGTGYSVYASAANGTSGLQRGSAIVYQWAASIPAGPTGSDTYTWAGTSPSATFNGPAGIGTTWKYTPGTAPSVGFTLWAATVQVSDSATNATTNFNWTSASVSAVGYAGSNGSAGASGASATTAYARIPGNPTPTTGNPQSAGVGSVPSNAQSTSYWGISATWSLNDPNPSSTNTLYQTNGFYDPSTGLITWNTPYISSLKVGSLSAITVNTGALNIDGNLFMASGGMINSGAFTGFSWPSSGTGFHLSAQGLRLGNYNTGGFISIDASATTVDFGKAAGPRLTFDSTASTLTLTSAALNAGTITGSTITGGVVRTAASGPRVAINESSSNGVTFYSDFTSNYAAWIGDSPSIGAYIRAGNGLAASGNKNGLEANAYSGVGVAANSVSNVAVQATSSGSSQYTLQVVNQSTGPAAIVQNASSSFPSMRVLNTSSGLGVEVVTGGTVGIRSQGGTIDAWGSNGFRVIDPAGASTAEKARVYYNSGAIKIEGTGATPVAIATNSGVVANFNTNYSTQLVGAFACNGNTPQGKASVNAACSDLSTAITLVNQLRAALIANGICV